MNNNKPKYGRSGCFARMIQSVKSNWKLADEVDELKHRLKLRNERISDLTEWVEAHREINDAMRADTRLIGMAAQADLERVSSVVAKVNQQNEQR